MSLRPPDSLRVLLTWPEPAASDFRRELQAVRPRVDITPIPATLLADYLQESGYYHVLHVTPDTWRSQARRQRQRFAAGVCLVVLGPEPASTADLEEAASGLCMPVALSEAECVALFCDVHRALGAGRSVEDIVAGSGGRLALAGREPAWPAAPDTPPTSSDAGGKVINTAEGDSYTVQQTVGSNYGIAIGAVTVKGDMVSGEKVVYYVDSDQVNSARDSASPIKLAQDAGGEQMHLNRNAAASVTRCTRCNQPVQPGDRFCQNCGTRLDQGIE